MRARILFNDRFTLSVMLAMGLLGFVLERRLVPLGPVVLGIILGGPLEERFIQTLTKSEGSVWEFVANPLGKVLGAICILVWLAPPLLAALRRGRPRR